MKKILSLCLLAAGVLSAGEHFKERGFYLGTNLLPDSKLVQVEALAARAAKAGYNTVYLNDYKFGTPWTYGDVYIRNVQKAVAALRKHNFKVVTGCIPISDCCAYLSDAPELAESLKVVNEPYTIKKGIFTPEEMLKNGSFEQGSKEWRLDPNMDISLDSTVAASGKSSIHFKFTG